MTYLEQYDALDGQPQAQAGLVARWLRTADLRPFCAELRAQRPVLRTPAFTLVARRDDVTEVLSRDADFSVRLYARSMDPVVGGPFMLARDAAPVNWREKGLMQAVLRPEDLPAVRALAGALADEALDAAEPSGRIEAVNTLGRYVAMRICGSYFGFPGPDLATMYRWSRATQTDMFKNLAGDATVHQASLRAGAEMTEYLRGLLREKRRELAADDGSPVRVVARRALRGLRQRQATSPGSRPARTGAGAAALDRCLELAAGETPPAAGPPQDVLSRLLRTHLPEELGFDDSRMVANIAGLLIGSGETTSQAVVQVLQQILSRPDVHQEAAAAASETDTARFDSYVWEALRLDPINPLVFRFTERDTVIAAGTPRETAVSRGTVVFALTASAMSDVHVPDPDAFHAGRPDPLTLHFGFGTHTCLGRHVAATVIPEVVRRVLLRPGVSLLPAPEGTLDFAGGPFPERFVLGLAAAAPPPPDADPVRAGAARVAEAVG